MFTQRFEYYRLILQLTHERNEKLVSYIRLTDGAIWGFLGLAAINLFNADSFPFKNLPIFLGLFALSMYMWRSTVKRYQTDIVNGYNRFAKNEEKLLVPYKESVAKNFVKDFAKPKDYDELLNY